MKQCIVCGIEYDPNSHNQKCCSADCVKHWGHIKTQRSYAEQKSSNQRIGKCIVCNKEFKYHFRQERGERKFCGRSCASKFYITNGQFDTWRYRSNKKQQRITVSCVICNTKIDVLQRDFDNHVKFDMQHCCSKNCRVKYTQSQLIGRKGHPFTDEMRKHQQMTMLSKYNVSNAFMLAKRRTKSKPQINIYELLCQEFPNVFEIEKRVTSTQGVELFADIVSHDLKLIIEFNGDYWHCHPDKYVSDYFHKVKCLTAQEIWDADAQRLEIFRKLGYHVYVIWEREYNDTTIDWKKSLHKWIETYGKIQSCDVKRSSVNNYSSADVKSGELLES